MDSEILGQYMMHYWIIFSRYIITATIFFLLYYVIFKNKWAYKKIQRKLPNNKDYIREVSYSLMTIFIFAGMGMLIFNSPITEYSKIYWDIGEYPIWYYVLSFPLMFFIHDTYFYWMHRTMHHPAIFKTAHLVHHKSTNPSPWAAYSFHPIEGFFEGAILPILAFALPLHFSTFGFFFLFQIVYNVYGHSGYEWYPKGFNNHWLGKWINTSIHHNLHHKHFDNSYGLYFTFWDRVMGTLHPLYNETFDEVKTRTKPQHPEQVIA